MRPKKRYCPLLHDTWKCGRIKGWCVRCARASKKRHKRKVQGTSLAPIPGLRTVREARGVGVRELARQTGISRYNLWTWEKGTARANRKNRMKLCQVLNVDERQLTFNPREGNQNGAK